MIAYYDKIKYQGESYYKFLWVWKLKLFINIEYMNAQATYRKKASK